MGLEHDISILGRVGLFRDLNRDQLRLLAFGAEHVKVPAGRNLFHEDSPADCAFVVIEGEIELFRIRNGKRTDLGRIAKGSLLGELALICEGRRPTSAGALVDSELLRLDQKLFHRLLEEYPETALRLHRILTANLKILLDRIAELGRSFSE
jgi:CRP-like cAMP-binding protein